MPLRKCDANMMILRRLLIRTCMALAILTMALPTTAQDVEPEILEALKSGDTAAAVSMLERQIELDRGYHLNYYMLGLIAYKQEKYRESLEHFETALDKKSNHLESIYYSGMAHLKLGHLEEAEEAMELGRKKAKDEQEHRFEDGYGLVMLEREKYQEADRAFRQALLGDSLNAEYHIHLGDANFYSGVPYLAIMEYEKALELDTAGLEVYYHWAEACLEIKDYTCAIDKLRTVLKKDSTHAAAWMRAGEIYFKAARSTRERDARVERFKETIGSYKRYLELSNARPDSSNVRVFFELAMSYVNLSGFEDAATYFEQVLSIPYEPKDIYFYYGKSLFWNKEYEKSAEMLQKHIAWVKEQDEDYTSSIRDDELYQLLGDSYFYRQPDKDYASAIPYYKKALESDPDQKRIVQNVAIAYHSLSSYEQALDYYDRRIEMGVDSGTASIVKNAAYCALNIANSTDEGGGEDLGDELGEEEFAQVDPVDPADYYLKAVEYMTLYLEYERTDLKALALVANTYLYQLSDCINGVKYYEQILSLEPDNCEAQKSLGYAYFGGVCNKNYTKALGYLQDAYQCAKNSSSKPCAGDVPLVLWIAQCYHLRAVEKTEAKQDAGEDFRKANEWYGQVLKCDPANPDARKGKDETEYEF